MVTGCCNARMEVVEMIFRGEGEDLMCIVKARCDGCDEIEENEFDYKMIKHLVESYVDEHCDLY